MARADFPLHAHNRSHFGRPLAQNQTDFDS
jgi:hypothetical protein